MEYQRLLKDTRQLVKLLEYDIRERAETAEVSEQLRQQHARLRVKKPYRVWVEEQITDAAVTWVLRTVFVRFLEDNRLWP